MRRALSIGVAALFVLGAVRPEHVDEWSLESRAAEGVTTGTDGRTLTVHFYGGPEFDERDPCTEDYRAIAQESSGAVAIRLQRRVPRYQPASFDCTLEAHSRSATVTLDAPLGRRVVRSEPKGIVVPVSQG